MKLLFIFSCFAFAAVAAYYCQPYIGDNSDVFTIIITVCTVFAGFLVAIISILGDPSLVPEGSWRQAELRRENIERRIIWHNYLFALYLLTIALVFFAAVLKKVPDTMTSHTLKEWIERAYLFFGVGAFMLSFALPFSLHKLQMDRLEREIQRRRHAAGLKDGQ